MKDSKQNISVFAFAIFLSLSQTLTQNVFATDLPNAVEDTHTAVSVTKNICNLSEIVRYVKLPPTNTPSSVDEPKCNQEVDVERGNAASRTSQSEQYFVKQENLSHLCVVSFDTHIQTVKLKTVYTDNANGGANAYSEDTYKYFYYPVKVQDLAGQQTEVLYLAFSERAFDQVGVALDAIFGASALRAQAKIKRETLEDIKALPVCAK